MIDRQYVVGLILIVSVVWLTMILCLIAVYLLLPSIELSTITYIDILIASVLRVLLAGSVLLVWLYSWNKLVKLYFQRNLYRSRIKRNALVTKRRKRNTRMAHVPRKSTF